MKILEQLSGHIYYCFMMSKIYGSVALKVTSSIN